MARILRIERCAECSHCQREYASDDMYYMDSVCHCDLLNPDVTGRDWLDPAGIDPACPLPEASGWISVGERLPECGERVLTVVRSGDYARVTTNERSAVFGDGGWLGDGGGWVTTHWQPLPALPEEASDGE